MPASSAAQMALAASTSSSGHVDGLGRRTLAFDREGGTMMERLAVRPEIAAFESSLRDRIERVSALEDERIARPRSLERATDGSLVVVSEFVPGSRLSDLLDAAAEQGIAPGVDAAFGYLLDVLPALCALHAGAGCAHGAIAPARLVLTPAGQVVLLDAIYGAALAHLRYSRRRLWTEFRIATPPSAGAPRLGPADDIAQAVMAGVMLVLGRPLYDDEYPDALPRILREVTEIGEIRGSAEFARGFETFLQRAFPVSHPRPYTAADDALIDLRALASELGLEACRRALREFVDQLDAPNGSPGALDVPDDITFDEAAVVPEPARHTLALDVFSDESLLADSIRVVDIEEVDDPLLEGSAEEPGEAEIPIDDLLQAPAPVDPHGHAAFSGRPALELHDEGGAGATPFVEEDEPDAPELEPAPQAIAPAPGDSPSAAGAHGSSRRARRTRSVRARKDRLRSAARALPMPALAAEPAAPPDDEPAEARAPEKPASTWLVSPERAAAFEPPIAEPPPSPAPPVMTSFAAPAAPPIPLAVVTPAPVAPAAIPARSLPPVAPPFPVSHSPSATAPPPPPAAVTLPAVTSWTPAPFPATPAAAPAAAPLAAPRVGSTPLKLREPVKPRGTRASLEVDDIYTAPPPAQPEPPPPSVFPWKLAVAALLAVAVLVVVGRARLPGAAAQVEETPPAADIAPAPRRAAAPPPSAPAPAPATTTTAATGRLEIETQPAGARVLIDGQPAGESPLVIESLSAGRHSVTFEAAAGSVKRLVRIEAGRTTKLDVPIFSGWVAVIAPFVLTIAESGRVVGTNEEPRLMLSPGPHDLTLTNADLGYQTVQRVEVVPGEVATVRLDPRGTVNLNASPWAEVHVGGKKVGDTPLAGLQLPLGLQEITFKHPDLGERTVSVTVKGNAPAAVSVTMTR